VTISQALEKILSEGTGVAGIQWWDRDIRPYQDTRSQDQDRDQDSNL